ncbi:hypothetical protein [Dactylosporangium sp. CA-092794]|uniref:hypothetical protein n=1 Tax=Dactylosporangium sp. CA-092794 TaxID=3239929 RepID=UPI003D91B454
MSETLTAVETALSPLTTALRADGYLLHLAVADGGGLRVRVEAGPDACADCLVPKPLFASILRDRLGEAGVTVGELALEYPA